MDKQETFEYTYSAKQQEEIEEIRKKYLPPEEDKMALIRKLDRDVGKKATMIAIIVGIIGAIIFGAGLSICLVSDSKNYIYGIPMGIIGMIICAITHPLYQTIVRKERARIAPQILALIEEIKN